MSAADLLERLRALLFRKSRAAELEEEMRLHLELEAAERVRRGADPDAARREARLAFGGVEHYKEEVRDASGVRPLQDFADDARFALRALRRNAGFTAAVVVVLGLAIGATTAVFTVVHDVLIAELPYPDADRLVVVQEQNSPTNRWALSTVDVRAIRDQNRSFDAFGAMSRGNASLAGAGEPEQVRVARVTSGVFAALGVRPARGRLLEPTDEPFGSPPVVVVSRAAAMQRLGGVDSAVGRTITLDGVSHTVVGVLPASFQDPAGAVAPAVAWPALQMREPTRRGPFWMLGVGRLKPGVDLAAATADLAGISERLAPLYPDFPDKTTRLTPHELREAVVGRSVSQLRLFAIAVALVLLVAIINVATLVLVRASARAQEFSVRTALGASRGRIARLILTENLVLTGVSAAVGRGVALLGLRLVGVIAPTLPRAGEIGLELGALFFVLAIAAVSGLLVSISPALAVLGGRAMRGRGDAGRSGGSRASQVVRGALVSAEFALALPLLLGAGLLLNSFMRLQRVDPGYDTRSTFSVNISLPSVRYPDPAATQAFFTRALQRVAEAPGVEDAGLSTSAPPNTGGNNNNFNLVDHPVAPGAAEHQSPWAYSTGGFFTALKVPVLEGRLFTDLDSANGPPVALVSRSWAARYFPGENALGRQLVEGGCYSCPLTTIVGIVGDVKYDGLAGNGDGVYVPLPQSGSRSAVLFVRTAGAPSSLIRPVIERLRALDPELALEGVTLSEQVSLSLGDPERWTMVLVAFASAALLLATLGIFGLMSYVVRRQRREIGVRLALGAEPGDVTRMIVGRGMRYALAGTVVGLGLAMLAGKWLRALLFDVTARDPVTMVAVTAMLLAAALLACLVPGLRAARIRPLEAIATE